jgi:hypothetical protein
MDKQFSSAPLGSQQRSADLMSAAQKMLTSSRNSTATAIPADSLQPSQPTPQIPPAPVDTRIITNNQIVPQTQPVQGEVMQPEAPKPTLRETMEQKLIGMMSPENRVDREAISQELRIAEKQKKAQDIENQIISRQMSYNNQIERLQSNPDALLNASKLNAQQNLLSREFSRELAELSFAQKIANDDYMGAERLMSDRIKDFQDQRNWEMQAFQVAFNFIQNDMTESEKLQAQQAFQEKQATEDFERQKELATFASQLRQNEARLSASMAGPTAPKIYSINGVDSIYDPETGTFVPAPTAQSQDTFGRLSQAKSKVDQITNITQMGGIGSSVGTSVLSRAPSGFLGTVGKALSVVGLPGLAKDAYSKLSGSQQNFISEVEQLRSTLSLDNLVNAKSRGATFGALSDREMQILSSSATKLGTWAITDKNGKVVGYNASQKDFKREMDKINNFAKIDYLLKGGSPADVGVQIINGQYVTKNSDGTITVLE